MIEFWGRSSKYGKIVEDPADRQLNQIRLLAHQ